MTKASNSKAMKSLSLIFLQIFIYVCIINFAECRTIRRDTETELLMTSSAIINNCQVGEYESEFGASFQVAETSNVTLLISINSNHPSLIGQSMTLKLFKDNTNLDLIFPNNPNGNYPIEVQQRTGDPGIQNLFIEYEFGLVIVALRIRSGQQSNNANYKVEVGTLNTPVLAAATSNVEFVDRCIEDPAAIITMDSRDISYNEVGTYTQKFGGSVHMPTGSSLSLRIIYNENHQALVGETQIVALYKDGVELRFQFGFVSEGEFSLEAGMREVYPNIFVRFDFGFVYNSLVIRDGSPLYNGVYTLTISTSSNFGIASANTQVWFGESTTAPVLERSNENVFVYSEYMDYTGYIGDSFVVLTSTWNVVEIIAEDTNNSPSVSWNWYFTSVDGERQLIVPTESIQIRNSRNSSVLSIKEGDQLCLGVYTVEASNSVGSDTGSVEINRIMVPTVTLQAGEHSASEGALGIGEHVDISQLGDSDGIVIEARDDIGFPRTTTNWYFSKCKYGPREKIENNGEFEIVSMPGVSRLVIRNAKERGYGYYFAVASNLAGLDEAYSILGRAPGFEETKTFHSVRGFTTGEIGESFKLLRNSLVSIVAEANAFPPVSFEWYQLDPLYLYTYENILKSDPYVTIANAINKSVLTQLRTPKIGFIKYTVKASNELGEAKQSSYIISSRSSENLNE